MLSCFSIDMDICVGQVGPLTVTVVYSSQFPSFGLMKDGLLVLTSARGNGEGPFMRPSEGWVVCSGSRKGAGRWLLVVQLVYGAQFRL